MNKQLRRAFRNYAKERFHYHIDRLHERQSLQAMINERAFPDGSVALEIWGRDCDLCESSYIRIFPNPTVFQIDKYMDHCYEWADGPMSIRILTPKEAEEFKPYFRDIAAEQMGY